MTLPESLEVTLTKEDVAVISTGGKIYDHILKTDNAIAVLREEVDPDFNFNIDPSRVFEVYMSRSDHIIPKIWIPYVNIRMQFDSYKAPEELVREFSVEQEE